MKYQKLKMAQWILGMSLAVVATGCGSGSGVAGLQAGVSSGECNSEVKLDFNNYLRVCNTAYDAASMRNCKSVAMTLVQKYPSLNCTVKGQDINMSSSQTYQVTAADVQKVIDSLTKNGY